MGAKYKKCLFIIILLVFIILSVAHIIGIRKIRSSNQSIDHNDGGLHNSNVTGAEKMMTASRQESEEQAKIKEREYFLKETFLYVPAQYWCIVGVILLLFMGGIVSGLTIGLMALDETNLTVLHKSGTKEEKEYASKILPIRKNSYLLLCTLLVANAIITETLPILLDKLLIESWQAIFIATILLLIFAEIIPQAFFTRFGLVAGAKLIWLVKFFIVIFFPVAYPLSLIIQRCIGKHQGIQYKRRELKELVSMLTGNQLTREEVRIMTGVLDLIEKHPAEIMIPLEDVFMLDIHMVVNESSIALIRSKGYSRVPLYHGSRDNIVAVLLVKNLISYESMAGMTLAQLPLTEIHSVKKSSPLFDVLTELRLGRHGHLALVVDETSESIPIGILTLEDVIEELLQDEIIDETDEFIDVKKKTRVPYRVQLKAPIPSSYLASKILTTQPIKGGDDYSKKKPPGFKRDKPLAIKSNQSSALLNQPDLAKEDLTDSSSIPFLSNV